MSKTRKLPTVKSLQMSSLPPTSPFLLTMFGVPLPPLMVGDGFYPCWLVLQMFLSSDRYGLTTSPCVLVTTDTSLLLWGIPRPLSRGGWDFPPHHSILRYFFYLFTYIYDILYVCFMYLDLFCVYVSSWGFPSLVVAYSHRNSGTRIIHIVYWGICG